MGWTDERMDDFAKHTDQRFDAVDRRLDKLDRHLERFDDRFATLQLTLLIFSGSVTTALIGLIATQL